jgi:hypothetical protein
MIGLTPGYKTPAVRIHSFSIPALLDTKHAEEFGRTLDDAQRAQLTGAAKAMQFAALNASDLQDRVDFATIASVWREAAEEKP